MGAHGWFLPFDLNSAIFGCEGSEICPYFYMEKTLIHPDDFWDEISLVVYAPRVHGPPTLLHLMLGQLPSLGTHLFVFFWKALSATCSNRDHTFLPYPPTHDTVESRRNFFSPPHPAEVLEARSGHSPIAATASLMLAAGPNSALQHSTSNAARPHFQPCRSCSSATAAGGRPPTAFRCEPPMVDHPDP